MELRSWWHDVGSRARDEAGLTVERNVQRYRHTLRTVAVRIDATLTSVQAAYLRGIVALTGSSVAFSALEEVDGIEGVAIESVDELVQRCSQFSKVRWLSDEVPPVVAILDRGLTTDRRPLAQSGAVEGPRWLTEQSVTVTNHRYGNVNAGPKPLVPGLGG